jgi:aldose 1-epimerase
MPCSKGEIFFIFRSCRATIVFHLFLAVLLCTAFSPGCGKSKPKSAVQTIFSARVETDQAGRQPVIVLSRQGAHPCEARIAPRAGANLFSLIYEGKELIYSPAELDKFDGSRPGIPVLYPSPCRLAGGKFTFDGESYNFGTNRDNTWIHGLVRTEPWEYDTPAADKSGAGVLTWIDFSPGSPLYEKFGYDHRLSLLFTLDEKGLRLEYKVHNRDSRKLPFGFGVHPYFNYPGPRSEAYVRVPAELQMEMENLIPNGNLLKVEDTPYDLRQPKAIGNLPMDNVFFPMTPQRSSYIEYRQAGVRLTLTASKEFTHLIVWNDLSNPFFCVENMTCSPDVYNLYSRGFEKESGLRTVPPQSTSEGWIHYLIESIQ